MNLVLLSRSSPSISCERWGAAPLSSPSTGPPDTGVDHYAVRLPADPDGAPAIFDRVRDRLFTYDIFPPRLVRHTLCPAGPIGQGTTIVQQFVLGPVALEMAVRVIEVWDREDERSREAGFIYASLPGHAECGTASFRVRQDDEGRVSILVDARSRPGLLLTRMASPIARLVQRGLTEAGLRRLARAFKR